MKTTKKPVTIRDLVDGFEDKKYRGVFGYGGQLSIRPEYQREFIYDDKKQAAVIRSIQKKLPLNVMYWNDAGNENYEIIDGQQRTLSICHFVEGRFSIIDEDTKRKCYFYNLPVDKREELLDYELMVYVCKGTASDRLEWFRTINIASVPLNAQELRNAVYTGPWLSDAKRYFNSYSWSDMSLSGEFVKGSAIRQEILEKVLHWISDEHIDDYMAAHQHDPTATDLKNYFRNVLEWVNDYFTPHGKRDYRPVMGTVPWGHLYNKHKDNMPDPQELTARIRKLHMDPDVTRSSGIYSYVLNDEEKHLNIRSFHESDKLAAYERQEGICAKTGVWMKFKDMEADHITPWSEGGKTTLENCQMISREENRRKSNK
ncbi:MAG: DUF262 domain-containing protein [Rhodobacteraceae bacterium]|nr:DUF262 domain-containing protein [Paracoccaceae bacterium]